MQTARIKSVKSIGFQRCMDLEVAHSDHNFYAEGLVTSNSHSISYAALSALTTYLKFKYPLQFFTTLFSESINEPKPIQEIQTIESELKHFGIKLLPPDINLSKIDFSIEGRNIRFGLSSIKGLGVKAVEKLLKFSVTNANRFQVFENAKQAGLNISILSAMIQSGCMDSLLNNSTRPSLTLQAQLWNMLTDREKTEAIRFGEQFGYNLFKVYAHMTQTTDAKGKKLIISETRNDTIKKKYLPKKIIYTQNNKKVKLTNIFYERRLLGYAYSYPLRDVFQEYYEGLMSVQEVMDAPDESNVAFVAVVLEKPKEKTSKSKNRFGKFFLGDETGITCGMIFDSAHSAKLTETKAKHDGELPTVERIVFCKGKKKGTAVFLNMLVDQCVDIFTGFGEKEGANE